MPDRDLSSQRANEAGPGLGSSLCYREIVTGKPLPLLSKFRLSYYTLLNILRRLEGSGQSMEYVIARSFQQFQYEQSLPQVGQACHTSPSIWL